MGSEPYGMIWVLTEINRCSRYLATFRTVIHKYEVHIRWTDESEIIRNQTKIEQKENRNRLIYADIDREVIKRNRINLMSRKLTV
jgi:hypothetical protein